MLPTPPKREDGPEFNPFLNALAHIGKIGARATITLTGNAHINAQSTYGPQVVCEVKVGSALYDWGVRLDSPNYRILFDKFGKNPKKWKGKVAVQVNSPIRKGYNPYIAVVQQDALRPKTTKKPAAKKRKK